MNSIINYICSVIHTPKIHLGEDIKIRVCGQLWPVIYKCDSSPVQIFTPYITSTFETRDFYLKSSFM